jgi:hypothetical protein
VSWAQEASMRPVDPGVNAVFPFCQHSLEMSPVLTH